MTDDETSTSSTETTPTIDAPAASARRPRRRAASRPAGPPEPSPTVPSTPQASLPTAGAEPSAPPAPPADEPEPATDTAADAPAVKKTSRRRTTRKAVASDLPAAADAEPQEAERPPENTVEPTPAPAKKAAARRRRAAVVADPFEADHADAAATMTDPQPTGTAPVTAFSPVFQAPDEAQITGAEEDEDAPAPTEDSGQTGSATTDDAEQDGNESATPSTRRRRSRGGRNRRRSTDSSGGDGASSEAGASVDEASAGAAEGDSPVRGTTGSQDGDGAESAPAASSSRRRRRRRGADATGDSAEDSRDAPVKVREPRSAAQSITSVEGSTRIEAKKQRRREGREAGRRRVPILSESEFLARRESVDRVMAIRQRADVTQIAVLEDDVLVEHYVALETQSSLLGNVYLGRVQNVLPSMEAAFIDIGKGRNAVLYAGEVNWDLMGDRHQARRIENALKPGQQILVQVSKDPVGHKGARLTSQISLPGRYLVYVPSGGSSGISRKLPDTERSRLKSLLKDILPDESGVIVRTAAEGASEEELTRDVKRLTERWDEIQQKAKAGKSATLLYAEPDIMLKVVRDLFTEDFTKLVISGDEAWDVVNEYVAYVAPDLVDRLEQYHGDADIFSAYRVDEQIAKALERKVWLPSGGSLVIDRTEAMTVVDVNTGKFTGSGGNLEQTVTKNNLEAAEEMVRQLRLRDIGGIIVIDFIDMVLENNRDLVLRRLVECLGRDRTRHQVAEVTSLGLVQMTRKRIGTGLVETFSVPCETCHGRGVVIESEPVTARGHDHDHDEPRRSSSSQSSRGRDRGAGASAESQSTGPSGVEKHGAAAATAAIAAALHPEARQDPELLEHQDVEDRAGQTEPGQLEPISADPVDLPPAKAPKSKAKKASTPRKAAAKKPAATKKATTKKKSAPEPVPEPEPAAEPVGAPS